MFDGNPFRPPQAEPYPGVPWAPDSEFKLVCDYCQQEIKSDENAINLLLGQVVLGKRNMTPMIGPSPHYPKGETNVHFDCLAMHIVEEMPWVATEVSDLLACKNLEEIDTFEFDEKEDRLCAACGTPFDE